MKKINCILVALLLMSVASFAASINTTRSNIKQGVDAKYTADGKLTLTFDKTKMPPSDIKALAGGVFIVTSDIILSKAECIALKAPIGTTISAGKYDIVTKGNGLQSAELKVGNATHKNEWPDKK